MTQVASRWKLTLTRTLSLRSFKVQMSCPELYPGTCSVRFYASGQRENCWENQFPRFFRIRHHLEAQQEEEATTEQISRYPLSKETPCRSILPFPRLAEQSYRDDLSQGQLPGREILKHFPSVSSSLGMSQKLLKFKGNALLFPNGKKCSEEGRMCLQKGIPL